VLINKETIRLYGIKVIFIYHLPISLESGKGKGTFIAENKVSVVQSSGIKFLSFSGDHSKKSNSLFCKKE